MRRRRRVEREAEGPRFSLEAGTGAFRVEDYLAARPFSNFLPGIAGKLGIPLWVYYVNRGQGISSAGVRDKDGQILEFYSFNKACLRIAAEGFRTFLRVDGAGVYEPFRKRDDAAIRQTMVIAPAELSILEENPRLGLDVEVTYYPVPNVRVAALVREVTIRNRGRRRRKLEWVDGLPRILPYGLDQARIKGIPRHIEGMMGVAAHGGFPLYRLKQTAADSEQVGALTGGNFYLPVGSRLGAGIVVDPEAVFGEPLSFERASVFEDGGARAVLDAPEYRENKTPSAMTVRRDLLPGGGEVKLVSVIGYAPRDEDLGALSRSLGKSGTAFLAGKRAENRDVVEEIADHAFTVSASPEFDGFCRQDFLDNVIRGGMPLVFDTAGGRSAFYVYSRQNGDLERDYHHFVLDPTYLSQGTGHYRSVLQNRRTDAWFFPEVEDSNLRTFLNLIQLDGYNPLEVKTLSYRIADGMKAERWLRENVEDPAERASFGAFLGRGFSPGELLLRCERALPARWRRDGWEPLLREVLAFSTEDEVGGLHEGFWVDHWHYNVDLLEVLASVYPERLGGMLVEESYTWFDDPDVIVPRREKYVDAGGGRIRVYGAVRRDAEKEARIGARSSLPYRVRTADGEGEIHRVSLLVKLLAIAVNRLATLDPAGTGIEMEAGKPGWNDSMNGLPGMPGSGLSETLELRRTVRFLAASLGEIRGRDRVKVFAELAVFLRALRPVMARRLGDRTAEGAFRYWDDATGLKETYREATRFGVDGREEEVSLEEIAAFLGEARRLLDAIFEEPGVLSAGGVPHTYFVNEVVSHRPSGRKNHLGFPTVEPLAFKQRPTKLFLEGAVHWMKDRPEEAARIAGAVRRSPLYDRTLRMYKSCENMAGESPELGRAVGAYPRGWIENESIYLHMEYKYLLELVRSGQLDTFWKEARSTLIPFMDPAVYGRSTLEGASFIVSSAYADPRLHGQAFQPRLSGITCEFLHLWILAVAGASPFRLGESRALELVLEPRLPGWLFTEAPCARRYHDPRDGWQDLELPAGAFAFKLLGRALVVYQNAARRPTWGARGCAPVAYRLSLRDGRVIEIDGSVVPAPHAAAVRAGEVRRIDVRLAPGR